MPPRIRREAPARRDVRIHKHINQARDYWSKWPAHLAEGDFCQAGEKGWGTVAQLTKAVATLRGWDHYDHVAIRDTVNALADELPQQSDLIDDGLSAAERMHGNFYEVYMDARRVEIAMRRVSPLPGILWSLLPEQYTAGQPFADGIEPG